MVSCHRPSSMRSGHGLPKPFVALLKKIAVRFHLGAAGEHNALAVHTLEPVLEHRPVVLDQNVRSHLDLVIRSNCQEVNDCCGKEKKI